MKEKFAEIYLDHGMIKKMHENEGYCERTISEALKRPRNTEIQMRIRELALTKYDGIMRSEKKQRRSS